MSIKAPNYYELHQNLLAQQMLELAIKEGHTKKLPVTSNKHYVPPPSKIKKDIMAVFKKQTGPISTNQLLNQVNAQAPNLRRVCRDLAKEGLIRTERTPDGCLYTFVGDVDLTNFL